MGAPTAGKERDAGPTPKAGLAGLTENLKSDVLSGFLVFLIALPLCLAIATASGFPAIAGIFTAVVGGLVTPWISNSEMTIKGPAAGLILIVFGAVDDFRKETEFTGDLDRQRQQIVATADAGGAPDPRIQQLNNQINRTAYRLTLGVGVVAAALQILFGLCRGGSLGDFFPTSTVHGLLASIGIIIISRQIHIVFGVPTPDGGPFALLQAIPSSIQHANWQVATIGLLALIVMFGLPLIKNQTFRKLPAPMLVLLLTVPLGMFVFDLDNDHAVRHTGDDNTIGPSFIGPSFLVDIPKQIAEGISTPDFRGVMSLVGAKWVIMFMLIGTLESMLSAKAVDLLDPWRRRTDLNRDVLAIGAANLVSAGIGGLPMISEIVRSSANINNGARTRFANMYHGIFLLGFVALMPGLIHKIPLAALAAMLCHTGFRLASPKAFFNVYRVGREQLIIFVTTIIVTLLTDLLIGIAAGIGVKWLIHAFNGMSISEMFVPSVEMADRNDGTHVVAVRKSIVFSNWIVLKRQIMALIDSDVELDVSKARLIDHTVMEKLYELEQEFETHGHQLTLVGLENHRPLSQHPHAARKRILEHTGI